MLNNIYFLTPELLLILVLLIILTHGIVYQEKRQEIISLNFSLLALVSLIILFFSQLLCPHNIIISYSLLCVTPFTQTIKLLLTISTTIVLIFSRTVLNSKKIKEYEFILLVLLALLGMLLLVSAQDLIIFYLSIELLSLSVYILASIQKNSELSTEAGLKYFILGSLSSGLLLFGSALLYLFTGETNLEGIFNVI